MQPRWIDLEGLANLRDVGGVPTTDGGVIADGVLLRSDNLQTLSESDVTRLLELHLTDVIDLRSSFEVDAEGPGPMASTAGVTVHHHSLFTEADRAVAETTADAAKALPWIEAVPSVQIENRNASVYLSYLADRPDSVLAALRDIADAEGAALVHCAAGKDRTGTIIALALRLADADPAAVAADYAASSERVQAVVDRLMATETYRANLTGRELQTHLSHPETMKAVLDHIDSEYGSVGEMLARIGWTDEDTTKIRKKLRPDLS